MLQWKKAMYACERTQKSEDRCLKMGRRKKVHGDKRDNAKVTQKP